MTQKLRAMMCNYGAVRILTAPLQLKNFSLTCQLVVSSSLGDRLKASILLFPTGAVSERMQDFDLFAGQKSRTDTEG